MKNHSPNAPFFDEMYKKNPDPWGFSSSAYEINRYERIYNALNHKHYNLIFEAGCSIGILTKKLASLGDSVIAIDISPTAVALANQQCAQVDNVSIHCASIADFRPEHETDLLILSEIGYYFNACEWKKIVEELIANCPSSATILASHWLGFSADHLLSGDEVHEIIHSVGGLQSVYRECNTHFRLERWIKS